MSERLVIIDGKSVFYRGYYAMPSLSTQDGVPTGGVYGFAVMALEIIKRLKPDYVCVAWDKKGTNIRLRRELYPAYKGNRKAAPPDFYEQIPLLHGLLESLGWPLYEIDDYEADDIMAAFAKQAGAQGVESFLVTSDLDVLQLVNEHTHIFTLKKGLTHIELFDVAHFEEKYGVGAHQWIDVKALKGDASDNIPGVAGVGEKTALQLVEQYQTLESIYEHLEDLKPTLRAKLEAGRDMAFLSKQLVTLYRDIPGLKLDLAQAKLRDGVRPEFVAELRKLEFRNLLRQAEAEMRRASSAQAGKSAGSNGRVGSSESPAPRQSTVEPSRASTAETAQSAMSFDQPLLPPAQSVPFQLDAFVANTPRALALNADSTALWLSIQAREYMQVSLEDLPRASLEAIANGPIIGHDLKSLLRTLLAAGINWPGSIAHDTRIGAFLLNSLIRSHELEDILGMSIDPSDPAQVIPAIWQAYDEQRAKLATMPEVEQLARDIEFPTISLLAHMEHRGVALDSEYLGRMSAEFAETIGQLEQEIYTHAGQEFTIGSPQQLAMILFEKLQLPTAGIKKGKTGYSTGASELDKLRALHPMVDLVTRWREYTKLKSTYIDALPRLVDAQGKLHTTYALDVAATGRLSSHDPNLQNIPTRTELGNAIRTAFVPAAGNVFVSADYSQFELRLVAVMADDKELIEDFNRGIDIHMATAAAVYGVPLEDVTKDMRRHAKTVNFGVLYGMSSHGLSVATGMLRTEAQEFIDKYFALHAPIRAYMHRTVAHGLSDGFVATMFGRRRPTPDLKSSNFVVREAAKRAAINMPIQGTEADLMKIAMLEVEKQLQAENLGEQILQVHDSIIVECPAANAEKVGQLLKTAMESVHELPVKLQVDVSVGQTWGEL